MAFDITAFLICLIGLQFKHFLADFCLQNLYMVTNKGRYGHPGGLLHAWVHASLTLVVLFVAAPDGTPILTLAAFEFFAHYHVDWAKEKLSEKMGVKKDTYPYWVALGIDQFMHHLTLIIVLWYTFAA